MPNGRPGDSPWTDFISHGRHDIFPADIAEMLLAIHAEDPSLIDPICYPDMSYWMEGKRLDQGRDKLKQIMEANGIKLA